MLELSVGVLNQTVSSRMGERRLGNKLDVFTNSAAGEW